MKFAKFKYTDAKGKTTEREVLVLAEASPNMLAIDVSHLSNEDQAEFWGTMEAMADEYKENMARVQEEFDLKYSIRTFAAERIVDRVDEEVLS